VEAASCPVCMHRFQSSWSENLVPRRLPCDHMCCTGCLKYLFNYQTVRCPVCNSSHVVQDVEDIPVDESMIGTIDGDEDDSWEDWPAVPPPTGADASEQTGKRPMRAHVDKHAGQRTGKRQARWEQNRCSTPPSGSSKPYSDVELTALLEMGFDVAVAERALTKSRGDVQGAINRLFEGPLQQEPVHSHNTRKRRSVNTVAGDGFSDTEDDAPTPTRHKKSLLQTPPRTGRTRGAAVIPQDDGGGANARQADCGWQADTEGDEQETNPRDVDALVAMGFHVDAATEALRRNGFNMEAALAHLLGDAPPVEPSATHVPPPPPQRPVRDKSHRRAHARTRDAAAAAPSPNGSRSSTFLGSDDRPRAFQPVQRAWDVRDTMDQHKLNADAEDQQKRKEVVREQLNFTEAFRQAKKEGLSSKDAMARAEELVGKPTVS